jgi:hypothetical protein
MSQGTLITSAEFSVGAYGIKLSFSVRSKWDPAHHTMVWTLDYDRKSDVGKYYMNFVCLVLVVTTSISLLLEDIVGHLQVMDHPNKELDLLKLKSELD